ncbi:hypothetical protein [Carnobacterium sp. TMP28]|uniref:hypothetical protein n=1 Tax=Carnobacterium sp. TMP28 TaxID=3397060 RepID=UPI0039DF6C79
MRAKLEGKEEVSFGVPKSSNIELEAKLRAENILNEAYRQTDSIYRQVQEQLVEFKQGIKQSKKEIEKEKQKNIQDMEKKIALLEVNYAVRHQLLKKIFEQEQEQIDAWFENRAFEFENNLTRKKQEYQNELDGYLDYLRKESEWLALDQEQPNIHSESKEVSLFLALQEKREQYELNELELANQLDYYTNLTNTKKNKGLKVSLVIIFLAIISVVQVLFSNSQFTIEAITPIVIAYSALYLFYIYSVQGRKEKKYKKHKKHSYYNQFLIGQHSKFKEELFFIEEEFKNLMSKKIISDKIERSFAGNFRFLTIMQQDLKESEIKRTILESENAALRKYLLMKDKIED